MHRRRSKTADTGWRPAGWAVLGVLVALGGMPEPGRGQDTAVRLRPPVEDCPLCDLWLRYEDVVLQAKQEVGPLRDGVFYFYHADDPGVIESLLRFAHEREELTVALQNDAAKRRALGEACGHRDHDSLGIDLEISTSARGILALLTARNRNTLVELRTEASQAVRGKIPVWF